MAKPEKRFKCGAVEAAVFENEIEKNGQKIKLKKVSIQKRYTNAEGEWKSTIATTQMICRSLSWLSTRRIGIWRCVRTMGLVSRLRTVRVGE